MTESDDGLVAPGDEDPARPLNRNEIEQLATEFALGELDDQGLQRLYDLLRSEHGAETAQIAWRELATTVDLRASVGDHFQETLRKKLTGRKDPSADKGFLATVYRRIGRQRPSLSEVRLPTGGGRSKGVSTGWLLPLAMVLVVAVWWWLSGQSGVAEVVRAAGAVSSEGRPVVTGGQVSRGVISLGPGAELGLAFRHGHTLRVRDAATLLPSDPDAVSIINGHLAITAGSADLRLGLPDGRLNVAPQARVVVQVLDGRSHVGVVAGQVTFVAGSARQVVGADQAVVGPGAPFVWLRETEWADHQLPMLAAVDGAERWEVTASAVPLANDARFIIADQRGRQVVLEPGLLRMPEAVGTQKWQLVDAPLRARRLRLGIDGSGQGFFHIDGLRETLALPFENSQLSFLIEGQARFEAIELRTGPPLLSFGGD